MDKKEHKCLNNNIPGSAKACSECKTYLGFKSIKCKHDITVLVNFVYK